MSITALSFVVFIFALLAIYYLLPKKFQWVVLLVASICFYIYGGFTTIIYVLISAACVFAQFSNPEGTVSENRTGEVGHVQLQSVFQPV